ncbi:hypothetical protein [Streptacidiphilus sp. MAP5-3]|uniref:hypothetical protein n=1 Tax=unclassified Streptacidiphilus TaxID=2643834 RepID=UPI0035188A3E
MRLRSTLPVAAAALLAATLAVPAQAMADTSASPTPADTSSATPAPTDSATPTPTPTDSSTPSPTDSASATPTASPSDTPSPTAAAPTVSGITTVRTATGAELGLAISAPSDVTQVSATFTPVQGNGSPGTVGPATVTTFSLISGTAQNGDWQSTGDLALARGVYDVSVTATDQDGLQGTATASRGMSYVPSPDFHNVTFAPTHLGLGNEALTVTGNATLFDPAKGDTGTPFHDTTGSFGVYLTWSKGEVTGFPDWNTGNFTLVAHPGPIGSDTFTVSSDPYWVTFDGPSAVVTTDPASATRIVLDRTSASGLINGSSVNVTGTVQIQAVDGTWHPLPDTPITWTDGTTPWGGQISATSGADGRFSIPMTVPAAATTWHFATPAAGGAGLDGFATASSAAFAVQNVEQQVSLQLSNPSIDEYSDLTFSYYVGSTTTAVPGNKIYVLQSNDGRTGWTNLGYIPINGPVYSAQIKAWVNNPHGYWRLWYPGAPGYPAAYSGVIHTFRFGTLITGAKPNTTWANKGQVLRFSGGLWDQGYGAWGAMRSTPVYLYFRPYRSTTWTYEGSGWTNSAGYFNLYGRAETGGTWEVAWFTGSSPWYVDAYGPGTYVHVG